MECKDYAVRPASKRDWPDIWSILQDVAASGDTFTYPIDLDERSGLAIWMGDTASSETLVALSPAGVLLGSAKVSANRDGPGAHVATASFIVSRDARARGVGRALVRSALDWARHRGFEAMQFNAVASSNAAATALYLSEGFSVVGRVPDAFRHPRLGDVDLLIMHRKLVS